MICNVCSRESLPFQCAHRDGIAVCFKCGPSGIDPPFALDRHPGIPIYTKLAMLLEARKANAAS